MSKVLVLRTCRENMKAYGGFVWPTEGPVKAPDWNPKPQCGGGLHGCLWGAGAIVYYSSSDDAKWLVVEVDEDCIVDLGSKVKFPRGVVVFCGCRHDAAKYIADRAPKDVVVNFTTVTAGAFGTAKAGHCGTAIAGYKGEATAGEGGTAIAGEGGTATAGNDGMATAGDGGMAMAGNRGMATAGYNGTATVGDRGTATAGNCGSATAGKHGTATAGDFGTATAGEGGKATAGEGGKATAGDGGTISIWLYDGSRLRLAIGYVGEDGIKPNVAYRVNDKGKFVKA